MGGIQTLYALMFRSSIYGSLIGMMPGLGSSVACFVAYGEEKRRAKNKDEWGTGIVEGIVAPESANNAVSGPSMIPLLTLAPSTIAAVLIGMFWSTDCSLANNLCNRTAPLHGRAVD